MEVIALEIKIYIGGGKSHWMTYDHPELIGKQYMCPEFECSLTYNKIDANVIVSTCDYQIAELWDRKKGQIGVGACWEPYYNKSKMLRENKFDIVATIDRGSDLPVTYSEQENILANVSFHKYPQDTPPIKGVVYIARKCLKRRVDFVTGLQKWVRVNSFGQCIKNTLIGRMHPECLRLRHWHDVNQCIYSKYMFVLALENTILVNNYVTEKLDLLWRLNTLPIYWGAPNWKEYVPSETSIVDVRQFQASADLVGKYLLKLIENNTLYSTHFGWHNRPMLPSFEKSIERGWDSFFCRLCRYILQNQTLRQMIVEKKEKTR